MFWFKCNYVDCVGTIFLLKENFNKPKVADQIKISRSVIDSGLTIIFLLVTFIPGFKF